MEVSLKDQVWLRIEEKEVAKWKRHSFTAVILTGN